MLVVLVSTSDPGLEIFPTHRVFAVDRRLDGEREPVDDPEAALAHLGDDARPAVVEVTRDGAAVVRGETGRLDVQLVDTLGHDGIAYTPDAAEALRRVREREDAVAYLMRPTTNRGRLRLRPRAARYCRRRRRTSFRSSSPGCSSTRCEPLARALPRTR